MLAEIVSSEKSYLEGLKELVLLYIQPAAAPLRSGANGTGRTETYISASERKAVFSVAEMIAHFHTTVFLPNLERVCLYVKAGTDFATKSDDALLRQAAIDVARVFTKHAAFLR